MTARQAMRWAAYRAAPEWQQHVAEVRRAALLEVVELQENGLSLEQARAQVGARLRADGAGSESALKRWGRAVRGLPRSQWLAHLVPTTRARADR